MGIFLEIAALYATVDAVFAEAEQQALQADDEAAFDKAALARSRNDQAYFLYLFTRFEAEVNASVQTLLANRLSSTVVWSERRIWQAWSRGSVRDIAFLSKIEVLTDKGRNDYATAREYYEGRNIIAHGQDWDAQFILPNVAQVMDEMAQRWVTS